MSFEIRINGNPFTMWKSATVQRSIDSNAGAFRFSNSTSSPVASYPVKAGDFVEITVNRVRKIFGFVDQISGSHDDSSHTIEVSGRDNVADLIDSSIPASAKVNAGPISLKALVEKVASSIGSKVKVSQTVSIDDFTEDELQAAASGDKCMEWLVSFARKRQVYLVPDGSGGIIIYRPDQANKAATAIIHKPGTPQNNVIAYSFSMSQQERFNTYLCRSQANFGNDAFAEYFSDGADKSGEARDGQIRESRYLEFQAEQAMGNKTCAQRAAEQSNIQRALGISYSVSLAGLAQANGVLWDFGQFVFVQDDCAGIVGTYLIKAVEYAQDIGSGSRTQLSIVPPDGYQVTAQPSAKDARSARTGEAYQKQTPATQGTIR